MNFYAGIDESMELLDDISYAVDYSIVGPRDNRVHEIRTDLFPFNTICYLERDFGNGVWRGCTGTLIGPNKVLTAAHCLYNHGFRRAPVRIRVSPGRCGRDKLPFGSIRALRSYVPSRYMNLQKASDLINLDYGVIILPHSFHRIKKYMTPRNFSDSDMKRISRESLVTIAGYPCDRPAGTLWRHSERITGMTPTRLLYNVDTCPGHSGSPIWVRCPKTRRRYIIGIHTTGPIDEEGRAFGCSRDSIYAPAGAGNSGIRVNYDLLEDINKPERRMQVVM